MGQASREQANYPRCLLVEWVATQCVIKAVDQSLLERCLNRHVRGDWGCVCEEDWKTNDEALNKGFRILSAYPIDTQMPCKGFGDNTLWIITESDRSVTTFLLPDEY